jgi:hypothetical protein
MASGVYTDFTLADAFDDMGSRLYDPNHVRWTEPELTLYIQQALRTYNALTNHFRDQVIFQSTLAQAFYDLPTIAPSLRAQTYSVSDAVNQIAYQLMEPPPQGNSWVGTLQYSLADILQALQQARDTFLLETGILLTRSTINTATVFPQQLSSINLPEEIVNLRRLSWSTPNGIQNVLRREDTWGLTNYAVGWQTPRASRPTAYSIGVQPPLVVQLAPVVIGTPILPDLFGTLELLTINRGEEPNLLTPNQSLGVPNDWAWVVIFGALAQLLQRDALAQDVARADYCQSRWTHGIKMAKAAAVVLSAAVNNSFTPLGSVQDADAYSPTWEMMLGNPRRILQAGQNLIALWPPPGVPIGGGNYTITLEVVRNAPVPTTATDALQIGNELVNDVLDYAQHLALFKECGIGQVEGVMDLMNQFMGICGTTVSLSTASRPNDPAATGQTTQDTRTVAYEAVNG